MSESINYRKNETELAKAALRDAAKALFGDNKPKGLNSDQHAMLEALVAKEFCRSHEEERNTIPYYKRLAAWMHIVSNQSAMAKHLASHGLAYAPSEVSNLIDEEKESELFGS